MTIYTPNSGEKKEETECLNPEVVTENVPPPKKKDEASIAVVALTTTRRRSNMASICVLLTALIVFAVGILGGIYLYQRMAHRRYQGWCGVSYYERQTEGYVPGESQYYSVHGEFEEHFEIDRDNGQYEKIDVPEFAECKQATILHDFNKNLTAIVDKDNARCFVIPLNRTVVTPPKDFWDLLSKLRSGYYLPDTEVVRQNYRVITPQVDNLANYGYYIWKECRWFDTFKMVREGEPVALSKKKRSACEYDGSEYSLGSTGSKVLQNVHINGCW